MGEILKRSHEDVLESSDEDSEGCIGPNPVAEESQKKRKGCLFP